jgi:hypothetical protein
MGEQMIYLMFDINSHSHYMIKIVIFVVDVHLFVHLDGPKE